MKGLSLWALLERSKYNCFFSVLNFSSAQIKQYILDIKTRYVGFYRHRQILQTLGFFLPLFHSLIRASWPGYFLVCPVSSSWVLYLSLHDVQLPIKPCNNLNHALWLTSILDNYCIKLYYIFTNCVFLYIWQPVYFILYYIMEIPWHSCISKIF